MFAAFNNIFTVKRTILLKNNTTQRWENRENLLPYICNYHYSCIYLSTWRNMALSILSFYMYIAILRLLFLLCTPYKGGMKCSAVALSTGSGSRYSVQILARILNHCVMLGKVLGPSLVCPFS